MFLVYLIELINMKKENTRKPFQINGINTVDKIMTATRKVLIRDGIQKFNTNYIAKMAGISVGSVYQYFSSKENILKALIERDYKNKIQLIDRMLDKIKGGPMENCFKEIVRLSLDIKIMNPEIERSAKAILPIEIFKDADQYLLKRLKSFFNDHRVMLKNDLDKSLFVLLNAFKRVAEALESQNKTDHEKSLLIEELCAMGSRYLAIS